MTSPASQEAEDLDRSVRFHVYRHFADTERTPTTAEIASRVGRSERAVEESYGRLAGLRALVLAPSTFNIWMAHPFSAVPTPYPVKSRHRAYWANCAWDALGIPAVVGGDSETVTRCADCNETLRLGVAGGKLLTTDGVIHFAVPPRRFWENIGFT